MLIGITGRIASGKSVVSKYFLNKGFKVLSLSKELRKKAIKKNIEITRENLQNFGNELRDKYGPEILSKKIISNINLKNNYVIEGIRNPFEVVEFRLLADFYLISINAHQKLRFNRVLLRQRDSDPKTWKEFKKIDNRDFGYNEDKNGQNVKRCMEIADFSITNNGTMQELINNIKLIELKLVKIK